MNKILRKIPVALLVLAITAGTFTSCKEDPITVQSVSLNKTTLSLVEGTTETLTPSIAPADAEDQSVSWSTSDASVATVSSGTVTAVSAGTATITVTTTDGGKTAVCAVTVTTATIKVTGVNIDKDTLSLAAGETANLVATVTPADATDKSVSWATDKPDVATVNSGTVTAVSAGTATITVTTTDGALTATCEVTVTAAETTITIAQLVTYIKAQNIAVNGSKALAEAGTYAEGIVAATNAEQNLYSMLSVVDGTGEANTGIFLYNKKFNTGYTVGDKIKISIADAICKNYKGMYEITWEQLSENDVTILSGNNPTTTPEITPAQLLANDYMGMYVTVKNVKSKNPEVTVWKGNTLFTDADGVNEFTVTNYEKVSWASNVIDNNVTADISGAAKADNGTATLYPNVAADVEALTSKLPHVFTGAVSVQAQGTTLYGSYSYIGTGTVAEVGFAYKTDTETEFTEVACETVAESFNYTLTELNNETTYSVKAYIKIGENKYYGEEKTFQQEVPDYTSNVDIVTNINNKDNPSYAHKVIIGTNTTEYDALKLGTSKKPGTYTTPALGLTGTKTLTFYAVAWKNKSCVLTITVNNGGTIEDASSKTFDLKSNDGLTKNSPYTIIPQPDDKYTVTLSGLTEESTLTFSTAADGPRCLIWGVNTK